MPSGPVFVLDAQGQPLMPLAEAHARKLLRSGKARRWPHPTLTVVQLTRTVEAPILRPVLLGLTIHRKTAELFILAAGRHRDFPLLYIVVEFPPRLRLKPRRITHRWRYRHHLTLRQFLTTGSVISTLLGLMPLSHAVILRTPTLQAADPGIVRRLRRYLMAGGMQVAITAPDGTIPPGFPHDMIALLEHFVAHPTRYASTMVASAILLPESGTKPTRWSDNADADDPATGIGMLTTPPLVGAIDYDSTDELRVLRLPVAADANGVTWRYIGVLADTPFQRWPLTPVVLLPLVPRTAQETVALFEDSAEIYEEFYPG
jgi:hypothetical protein